MGIFVPHQNHLPESSSWVWNLSPPKNGPPKTKRPDLFADLKFGHPKNGGSTPPPTKKKHPWIDRSKLGHPNWWQLLKLDMENDPSKEAKMALHSLILKTRWTTREASFKHLFLFFLVHIFQQVKPSKYKPVLECNSKGWSNFFPFLWSFESIFVFFPETWGVPPWRTAWNIGMVYIKTSQLGRKNICGRFVVIFCLIMILMKK